MTTRDISWTADAACASRTELPWLMDRADIDDWDKLRMRTVCDTCPVLLDCLAAVDDLDVTGGWWAGHDRAPHAFTVTPTPDWATGAPAPAASSAAPITWVPVRSRRTGNVLGTQAALSFDVIGGAA